MRRSGLSFVASPSFSDQNHHDTKTLNTHIMNSRMIEFKYTVSRGRDTYGYNICTLYVDGRKVARCNGGGYDMKGTCFGDWIAKAFADRLLNLDPSTMPEHSHWEGERARVCAGKCKDDYRNTVMEAIANGGTGEGIELMKLSEDCFECPTCKGPTMQTRDGKTVNDGRYFYGLTFHNPNYDPSKAVIGKDFTDRTLTKGDVGSEGKTVEQAEKDGNSFGLERYQAFYSASSKVPTKLHRVPLIDGACGFSSVESIAKAIGIELEYVPCRSKNLTIYRVHDTRQTVNA